MCGLFGLHSRGCHSALKLTCKRIVVGGGLVPFLPVRPSISRIMSCISAFHFALKLTCEKKSPGVSSPVATVRPTISRIMSCTRGSHAWQADMWGKGGGEEQVLLVLSSSSLLNVVIFETQVRQFAHLWLSIIPVEGEKIAATHCR